MPIASLFTKALGVAALGTAAYFWHAAQVDEFEQRLVDEAAAARAQAVEKITAQNAEFRRQLQEAERVAEFEKAALADLVHRIAADKRLLESERAGFAARVAAATQAQLRAYAEVADDHLSGCRGDVERFGVEAAQCASTAWRLRTDIEALTNACNANLGALEAQP